MAYQRNGYYYQSRRRGDRVVTEYLGSATWAQAAADLDAFEREEAAAERAAREADLQLDRDIEALGRVVRSVANAVLTASGYHTHKRQWRKQRHGHDNSEATPPS